MFLIFVLGTQKLVIFRKTQIPSSYVVVPWFNQNPVRSNMEHKIYKKQKRKKAYRLGQPGKL